MSTEPQSRVSLDGPSNGLVSQFDLHLKVIGDRYLGFFLERSVSHDLRHSLIPNLLFADGGSKRLSESLSARRRRMLANFSLHSIDSLWRLHHKAAAVDFFFDARLEPDTSRAAWNEIRDNVERGAIQQDPCP